jgi:hypothetical protein
MRHRVTALLAASVLVACADAPEATLTGVDFEPLASNTAAGPSASGHWELELFPGTTGKYSFNVRQHADGSVTGEFQLMENFDGRIERVHGTLTCLTILPDGRTAHAGGVIDHSTYSDDELPGRGVILRVVDNGEGRNAVDTASDIVYGFINPDFPQAFCDLGTAVYNPASLPVERGNIQVR